MTFTEVRELVRAAVRRSNLLVLTTDQMIVCTVCISRLKQVILYISRESVIIKQERATWSVTDLDGCSL